MKVFKSIAVAFSMYSKIPMPRFEWASDDMKYHLCFFPWIGAVIGLLEWGLYAAAKHYELNNILWIMLTMVLPFIVTGGFHVDGFMDTMDALNSYQDRERKLEILKDPHIGAFSVISLAIYCMLGIGFLGQLYTVKRCVMLCFSFFISRCLSGISVVTFEMAKKNGMLNTSVTTARKNTVRNILIIQLMACVIIMCHLDYKTTMIIIISYLLSFAYYRVMSYRQFGGINGDLAGFFVTVSELVAVILVSVGGMI